MAVPEKKSDYKYSYADYLSWPDEERWEIIDGVPYNMSPAPNPRHQEILVELTRQIANFLRKKYCRVYAAPFDVRFYDADEASVDDDKLTTVVQPDIAVICEPEKIDERGCKGAPDICIEILSESTSYKDQTVKLKLYEKHGVKEYWLVNPGNGTIVVYSLKEGSYGKPAYYMKDDVVETPVLPGLRITLPDVFSSFEE